MERKITLQFLLMLQGRHTLKLQFNLVLNTVGVLVLSQDRQQHVGEVAPFRKSPYECDDKGHEAS